MILLVVASFFLCQALGHGIPGENSASRHGRIKRIAGGEFSEIEIHPWLVSIQLLGSHICGGSILSESIVLTAAHCAVDSPVDLSLRIGSSRVDKGGSRHEVVGIKIHEQYRRSADQLVNDLALIKASPPFKLGKYARSIHLVKRGGAVVPGTIASIAGWGRMTGEGQRTKQLRRASLRIIENGLCAMYYGDYSGTEISANGQICAAAAGIEACRGDSGSPLVINHVQVGVMSCGNGCNSIGANLLYPGVYTNVAVYRDWIDQNLRDLSSH